MTEERQEKNRRLGEWVEPLPNQPPQYHGQISPLWMWFGYNNGKVSLEFGIGSLHERGRYN